LQTVYTDHQRDRHRHEAARTFSAERVRSPASYKETMLTEECSMPHNIEYRHPSKYIKLPPRQEE
jgi:hypothetical protein